MWGGVVCVLLCVASGGGGGARGPSRRAWKDVPTRQGVVRGYASGRHYAYFGIPYAKPTTAQRRFESPKPPPRWDGIFDATYRVRCPQPPPARPGPGPAPDEDCLMLNIFAPMHAYESAVLVHVHGGGFQTGWGHLQPPERLLSQDILVVTLNYRLGALGFLCLGLPGAPGNAGLKDIVAALYWLQMNIANFGGNPRDVTLYGTRSGAIAVHMIILNDVTQGLFHKAILESGSAISAFAMTHDPLALAEETASDMGMLDSELTGKLQVFYKSSKPELLVNNATMFKPCIEKGTNARLIEQDPLHSLQKGHFYETPILFTFNSNDGMSALLENVNKWSGTFEEFFEEFLPENLAIHNDSLRAKIGDLVRRYYTHGKENEETINHKQSIMDYVEDIAIKYPVVKSAILHAQKSQPVYLMEFAYKHNAKEKSGGEGNDIFHFIFSNETFSGSNELVANKLINMWSNFILHGDPTPITTVLLPSIWLPVRPGADLDPYSGLRCLRLDRGASMAEPTCKQSLVFWDRLYSRLRAHTTKKNQD